MHRHDCMSGKMCMGYCFWAKTQLWFFFFFLVHGSLGTLVCLEWVAPLIFFLFSFSSLLANCLWISLLLFLPRFPRPSFFPFSLLLAHFSSFPFALVPSFLTFFYFLISSSQQRVRENAGRGEGDHGGETWWFRQWTAMVKMGEWQRLWSREGLIMVMVRWFGWLVLWFLRPWWLREFGKHEGTVLIGFAVVMSEV
jgi:hypothetical protein